MAMLTLGIAAWWPPVVPVPLYDGNLRSLPFLLKSRANQSVATGIKSSAR